MHDSVTVHMAALPDRIWNLISDVRNTSRFSAETFDADWLGGATGPGVGVEFKGHVNRNGWGVKYWTKCRITACEPGREFAFAVMINDRPVNTWRYHLEPKGDGTDVTESFQLEDKVWLRGYWLLAGHGPWSRRKTNLANMRTTLERIRAEAEAG
ncbi:MAG: SRPBCC family protein [Acidimicrobiia bacterium]